MKTKANFILNGVPMYAVDDRIVVDAVTENAPQWTVTAMDTGAKVGQHVAGTARQSRSIDVTFKIHERDQTARMEVLNKVITWAANGGEAELDYRPGQVCRVLCAQLPAFGSARDWTAPMTVSFVAYWPPYWTERDADSASAASATGTSGSMTLNLRGNADAPAWIAAKNTGNTTVNVLAIAANGYNIWFGSLGLAVNETARVEYNDGFQSITIVGADGVTVRSAMAKRTAASSDDIMLRPGANGILVGSDGTVAWTVKAFGRWA